MKTTNSTNTTNTTKVTNTTKTTNTTKNSYPTFIASSNGAFLVFVPDLDIYTEGNSLTEAIEAARDAIGIKGIAMEDDGIVIPDPSTSEQSLAKAREDADDVFDYSQGILTYVDVDFHEYRLKHDNRMVRRNVTLPCWLDYAAEKAQLNVSKILQEALKKTLKTTR